MINYQNGNPKIKTRGVDSTIIPWGLPTGCGAAISHGAALGTRNSPPPSWSPRNPQEQAAPRCAAPAEETSERGHKHQKEQNGDNLRRIFLNRLESPSPFGDSNKSLPMRHAKC